MFGRDEKKQEAIRKIQSELNDKKLQVKIARELGELDIDKLSEIYFPDDPLTIFLAKKRQNTDEVQH